MINININNNEPLLDLDNKFLDRNTWYLVIETPTAHKKYLGALVISPDTMTLIAFVNGQKFPQSWSNTRNVGYKLQKISNQNIEVNVNYEQK